MRIVVRDKAELRRIGKLCSTLNNNSVTFPITIFAGDNETVAFMAGRTDREFSVTTENGKQRFQMSDREGAYQEWIEREKEWMRTEIEKICKDSQELVKNVKALTKR